ncbi:MAG: AsmA family protein [Desulfovibrio sp.]|jgi:AsmA protein|nr:AsmA family protein [Desulfovibrio sp.]
MLHPVLPAHIPPLRAPGPRRPRLFRFLLRAAATLFLLIVSVSASLYILCLTKPDLVAAEVQKMLSDATGLPFRIRGALRPVFFPLPGLEASDVFIAAAGKIAPAGDERPLARARGLGVYLDPLSLLRGKFRVSRAEFYKPVITLSYDGEGRPLWLRRPEENAEDGTGRDDAADGGTPQNDEESEAASREARLAILREAVNLLCSPPGDGMPPIVVREGRFFFYTAQGDLLLSLREVNGSFSPTTEGENFHVSAAFALPDADLSLRFSLAAGIGRTASPVKGSIGGVLGMAPPGSREIKAEFSSGFDLSTDGSVLNLPGFSLNAEGDALRGDLRVDLGTPECTGKVTLDKLSLTRWFGFGRVLPPGLRQALHAMSGEFDLVFNRNKVEAHNLAAAAGGLNLQGYVGTPDFSDPAVVVRVELAGRPDLDALLPFLGVAGRRLPDPQPPSFDHPPLAPYPDDPSAPPPPTGEGIVPGYDINIHADDILLHGVEGGPLDVRVHPAPDGSNRTRVDIKAEGLLRGRADGYIDVDAAGLLMRYNVADMDLGMLPENEGSVTRIAGIATGVCEIDMPVREDGAIADDWPLRADVLVRNMQISGRFRGEDWSLLFGSAAGKGAGSIHAVLEKGVSIVGDWNLDGRALRASWSPAGDDSVKGNFSGTLLWPPMPPDRAEGGEGKEQSYTVERVEGKSSLTGVMTLPLASFFAPLRGKATADFTWNVHAEKLHIRKAVFEGMGSYAESAASLDFSGPASSVQAAPSFKLSPRELFAAWKIGIPEAAQVPKVFSGRTELRIDNSGLSLEKIKAEADSSPLSGDIAVRWAPFAADLRDRQNNGAAADPGLRELWTVRLFSEQLDLDSFFPADEQQGQGQQEQREAARTDGGKNRAGSEKPWNLSFVKGLAADVRIQARNIRKSRMTAENAVFTAMLRKNDISLRFTTDKFYGGACDLSLQGTVHPDSQVRLQRGGLRLRGVALGGLMVDYAGERSYAGTADLDAEMNGLFARSVDFPAGLSGSWNLKIKDGLYPAFFSGPDSRLSNTFSLASASGPLDRGVIRSDNFMLGGPMVDMKGGGWYDLNTRDLDIQISVTLAKVPTLPVHFYGNAASPRMNIRGVDMVLETMQAAGTGLFGLIRGVLELPAKAVTGIGSLFESDPKGGRAQKTPRGQTPGAGSAAPAKPPVRGSTMPIRR